ncbi:MAG: methyltransferase domain-containing protein [Planctomycetales bacterium]|nr:methyltransferase domain-containing protein [Planctomycetales bacterium]
MTSSTERFPTSAEMSVAGLGCRFCGQPIRHVVVDLGLQPLCQSRVLREHLNEHERCYPLRAYVCDHCWLVQVQEHVGGEEIFSHYAYFSSYSDTLLAHSKVYVDQMIERFGLNQASFVVELASNDGYLLQYFVEQQIPCLGVEPAANVADAAREKGVPSLVKFFGTVTASEMQAAGQQADLLVANNVLAHVPELNDFVAGMKIALKPQGVITVEVSHLVKIIENNLFDTIYQEHYCYYLVSTLQRIFQHHGLTIFDVDELPTQGGSIRIYARHSENSSLPVSENVHRIIANEESNGYHRLQAYARFAEQVAAAKRDLLACLIELKRQGKRIAAYGAPGKGNTLLNYCGIREDFLDYTVDRNPMKQNTFLVGSRIPVHAPEAIAATKPDYVLLLPWNLERELTEQLSYIRQWGGSFILPLPHLRVIN